jgi:glutamate--cysteine ligase
VADAAVEVLQSMKSFYENTVDDVLKDFIMDIVLYQIAKFEDADNRYAWKVRKVFDDGFVKKGLQLCKEKESMINETEY